MIRNGTIIAAILGSIAFAPICPYASVMGVAATLIWRNKLGNAVENLFSKQSYGVRHSFA